jgi:MoxR-like ATPase
VATATAPAGTSLQARYQDIFGEDGFLNRYNVERREDVDLLGLALISAVDLLFLGEPGVGKTWAIELMTNYCLVDMTLFTHLLAKDQSVAELLGPKDVMAMKAGRESRMIDGYLPKANVAYLDELFKASPPMLNPLLDIYATRKLKIGGNVIDCSQLLSIISSSNELPDREDLMAFRDRIAITKEVLPVKTPEGRRAVTDIQLGYDTGGIDTDGLVPLTLDEVKAIRAEVRQVEVPEVIRDMMSEIEQRCMEAGHPISQRRKRDIWRVVKSRTWARGGSKVTADDFLPAQHMVWNHPDHRDSGRAIILDFASAFTRKAALLREALEPVLNELQSLKAQIDAEPDAVEKGNLMDGGFKFLRQIRALQRDANDNIREGEAQGQDVSMVRDVLAELDRTHDWARDLLTGDEN